ncbi:MAG TPA: hypothetical protein VI011_16970 [Asanoa sp.]
MRAVDLLRRLDDAVLPPLARALAKVDQGPARMKVLTGVALVSATAVLLTAVWAAQRVPGPDLTEGDVVRVGVREGGSIPSYVARSRTELDRLAATGGSPYALVSLDAYVVPDRLRVVLDGTTVSEVFARVNRPELQTPVVRIPVRKVPADVVAGMLLVAERKDREARDAQDRAARTANPSLERALLRAAQTERAEAAAYRDLCSCVYAAVVRAAPNALKRLAVRRGVRAVDPAPEVRRLDRAVFLPPLPEQQDVVRPPVGATPSAGPVVATTTQPAPAGPAAPEPASPSPTAASTEVTAAPPDQTGAPSSPAG